MKIPQDRKVPFGVFAKTVQYYPMISVNIIIKNDKGEYLWVKRKNNPAQGEWWIPGGRLFNGETITKGAVAVLKNETGITGKVVYQSREYFEEIFDTSQWDNDDRHIYPYEIEAVHYIATVVVMSIENMDEVKLDDQSKEYTWSKEILSAHPFLNNYFKACKDYL